KKETFLSAIQLIQDSLPSEYIQNYILLQRVVICVNEAKGNTLSEQFSHLYNSIKGDAFRQKILHELADLITHPVDIKLMHEVVENLGKESADAKALIRFCAHCLMNEKPDELPRLREFGFDAEMTREICVLAPHCSAILDYNIIEDTFDMQF